MAIRIVKDLEARPDATRLPGGVGLGQTLESSAKPETVTILYMLDGRHNVWFRRDDETLVKCLRFEASIDPAGTPLEHQVTLASGSGQGPLALVEIDATIETPSGVPLSSAVTVRLVSRT